MKRFFQIALPTLTLLSLAFIFSNSLSSGEAAGAKRGVVVEITQEILEVFTEEEVQFSDEGLTVFSKAFHVLEFCLFSFFLSSSVFLRQGRGEGIYQKILLCGAFCALADEQLQMLSSGRGPRLSDVFVDLAGVMLGYAVAYLLSFLIARRKKNVGDISAS